MALLGVVLMILGLASRLGGLAAYRRISASESRPVTPSFLPGTPWLRVRSDRGPFKAIVAGTYGAILVGMVLVMVGVVA